MSTSKHTRSVFTRAFQTNFSLSFSLFSESSKTAALTGSKGAHNLVYPHQSTSTLSLPYILLTSWDGDGMKTFERFFRKRGGTINKDLLKS